MTEYEFILQELNKALSSQETIALDTVRRWMQCPDLGVQRRLWWYLLFPDDDRIYPPLISEELIEFRSNYLARCLKEDPSENAGDNRQMAADETLEWFFSLKEEFEDNRETAEHLKCWLGQLYIQSDQKVRDVIEVRILNRLFEESIWRDFFADWKDNNKLGDVYQKTLKIGRLNSREETITEIETAANSEEPIPLVLVRSWMNDSSIDVQAAVLDNILISNDAYERIIPALDSYEIICFQLHFYERCIVEAPINSEGWSRYSAAHEIMAWFKFSDNNILNFLSDVKSRLANLYLQGGREVREAIIYGILRYLLDEPKWREFFADWLNDPQLAEAVQHEPDWSG